ncbi:MAG: glutamate--tRNA ligase family protein [Candidatus Nanoarchaeia archaeon]|nr:glutamate--tRNA ligase family protein [Candidatus Nanoarchaeia archaeon]
MEIDKRIIKAYALKNAIEHEGKAVAGSVISGLFNHGLTKEGIKDIMPIVNAILREVNAVSLAEQEKEFMPLKNIIGHRFERGDELPELEGAERGVVMRFSPSPSGPMHLGHIFTGMVSSLYVKKYGGKFYLQIEDTNPENIYAPAYKLLKEDADWIFGNVSETIIQSERMKLYYKYIEKLFEKEAIYVCICSSEKFKKLVDAQKSCPCREISKKENLERWKKMLDKKGYKEGRAVIRFKSDLNDPNPAFRDFPLARIILKKHPRQGKKYRVWPLMNLCVTVDDIELNKTHIIRAKEHRDNATRQKMIYKSLGLEKIYPRTYFLGRYNFTDLAISDTKTRKAIEKGKFWGWDDIRLPFVLPFKKRGYQKEAFEKLVIQRGLSEVDKVISKEDFFKVLNNFNREILKDKCRKADFQKTNEKNSNAIILMPDAKKVFGKIDVKPKKDEIIYFSRIGYAKFNERKAKKPVFWFCHE